MIHLDTSFLIRAVRPGSPESRRALAWHRDGDTLVTSAVAWTEFLCGPLDSADLERAFRLIGRWRSYEPSDADAAARLFNESGRRRRSLRDCMIAAAALRDGAALATSNLADFSRFVGSGLRLVGESSNGRV